jgi:hypothetical protein
MSLKVRLRFEGESSCGVPKFWVLVVIFHPREIIKDYNRFATHLRKN